MKRATDETTVKTVLFVFSNLSYPPQEGQHANHVLLMQGLKAEGWQIGVVALQRCGTALDLPALSRSVGGLVHAQAMPTRLSYPLLLVRNLLPWRSALCRTLQALAGAHPHAVVHLEGVGLLPLVPMLRGRAVVVTTTDAWSLRQRRLATRARTVLRRLALRSYEALTLWAERRFMPQAAAAQVVSPADAAHLQQQVPAARVACIPIALPALPQLLATAMASRRADAPPVVLFWGDIRVPHIADGLRWLLQEVIPLVQAPAQWVVLGRGAPPPELQQAAPAVRFVDWVQDIDSFVHAAAVVVLPDAAGTGLKNRAIHAMACAVPVVGTGAAFEGFGVADGQEAFVRDTPAAFAQAVQLVLQDEKAAAGLAARGRDFALDGYSLQAVAQRWARLYASALAGPKADG